MSAMSDAVTNGPRATSAKVAHIEAQIRLHEAKERKARDQSTAHRKRANGDGPLAKSRRIRADVQATVADRHRAKANQLRADLAKAKADEAARNVKHVKRTVASTAAEGLTPKAASQAKPPGQAKAGQARPSQTKRGGQPMPHGRLPGPTDGCSSLVEHVTHLRAAYNEPPTKGTPAMTVSGEAVNVEQTRSNLDQLKGQVTDLRGSFEGISGSLASGGLNQLAGSLASADDSLDSVLTQITAAEKHLADQEAIAEAAQAAGEMHTDTSFYA